MESSQVVVGRNIRAARKARGWTQEQLADRAGMIAHEISRLERGVRDLRVSTFVKLAVALEVDAAALVEGLGAGKKKASAP